METDGKCFARVKDRRTGLEKFCGKPTHVSDLCYQHRRRHEAFVTRKGSSSTRRRHDS